MLSHHHRYTGQVSSIITFSSTFAKKGYGAKTLPKMLESSPAAHVTETSFLHVLYLLIILVPSTFSIIFSPTQIIWTWFFCLAGLQVVWGCFLTLTFLVNLLLNVNLLLTLPMYHKFTLPSQISSQ